MTAQVNVLGKKPGGEPRRYLVDAGELHIIRTRTGNLTWCGIDGRGRILVPADQAQAQAVENRTAPETKHADRCYECFRSEMPQPDPAIWGPPRPPQT